jgi:nucleoid-associated protein YgaU
MLREQLRQTQQQGAAAALELSQLRTRLALLAPASTGSLAAPTRPGTQTVSFAAPPPLPPAETRTPAASAAAGGTSSATTAPAASGVRTHVVQTGDTLSRIATRYYGDAKRWNEIVEANREVIPSPDRLAVGMTLKIP